MSYRTKGYLKLSEQDEYNNGCLPDTGLKYFDSLHSLSNNTLIETLYDIRTFLGAEKEDVLINACGEDGRVDVFVLENYNGDRASSIELGQWRKGEIKLYHCTYSFTIENCESVKIPKLEGYRYE